MSSTPAEDELDTKLQAMKEEELLDFIRDTVARLHVLGDRLEDYVKTNKVEGGDVVSLERSIEPVGEVGEPSPEEKP